MWWPNVVNAGCFPTEDITETTGKVWDPQIGVWWISGRNVSILISWLWWLYCGWVRENALCKKYTLNIWVVKEHQVSNSLSYGSEKKKFFVLSLPLFPKLEMIQRKIKFKSLFQLWPKALPLYLTKSKGCSQFGQPNLFVLMVGDRLPGMDWANSSRDQTRGWEGWGKAQPCLMWGTSAWGT